jgi:hypothetical protein
VARPDSNARRRYRPNRCARHHRETSVRTHWQYANSHFLEAGQESYRECLARPYTVFCEMGPQLFHVLKPIRDTSSGLF